MKKTPLKFTKFLRLSSICFTMTTVNAGIVSFTATGTADTTTLGYISGNSYTFTLVTGETFSNNGSSFFNSTTFSWREEQTNEDQLFTSITGSGLSGSFTRPVFNTGDPFSLIQSQKNSGADNVVIAAEASASNIGIQVNGGLSNLKAITFYMTNAGTSFTYSGSYTEPTAYFQNSNGIFTPTGSNKFIRLITVSDGTVLFTMNSFIISNSPVPEPSNYAILTGAILLSVVIIRRRSISI